MHDRQYRQQLSWHGECVGIVHEFGISGLSFCLTRTPVRSPR